MAIILRCTRGQARIWKVGATSRLAREASSSRNGPDGGEACRMRTWTPRSQSDCNVSRMGTYRPRARSRVPMGASTMSCFTFAVAIHTEVRAPAMASVTRS